MERITPERQQILNVLADGRSYTVGQVATAIGKQTNNTNKLLTGLLRQGLISQPAWGVYASQPHQDNGVPPEPAPKTDCGVYVLRNGQYYKIGRSNNVEWRVKQLCTALPEQTVHIITIHTDTPDQLERDLYERYASKR